MYGREDILCIECNIYNPEIFVFPLSMTSEMWELCAASSTMEVVRMDNLCNSSDLKEDFVALPWDTLLSL